MSPLSLSRAAEFVCSGCRTTKSKTGTSWELGSAVSVHIMVGRDTATSPSAPAVSSAKAVAPAAARGVDSAPFYLVFPLLLSLGCASSLPCQNQVVHKNVSALLPSLNHLAGFKNRGRKGFRKWITFWVIFFAFWAFC